MAALSFRRRILLALLLLGVLPTSLAIVGWMQAFRNLTPTTAGRATFEELGATARDYLRQADTTALTPEARLALGRHREALSRALRQSQQALTYSQWWAYGTTLVVVILGSLLLYLSVLTVRSLSRQLSAPIEELIEWTGYLRRGEPLPTAERHGGAPEFAALRQALRDTAAELEQARAAELEAERLRAFREVARRVAHEMKNPLTPVRLAVRQLAETSTPAQRDALDVLIAESGRLEQLAREFATLGRLPEGPSAEVDLGELLADLLRTSVPPGVETALVVEPGTPTVIGHYDPLRRAFGNLIRNAVEAMAGQGRIDVRIAARDDWVQVSLADHGPGISPEKRNRIFEPYYTEKEGGTGLGLSLVRHTVEFHCGTVTVSDTPGGGATFEVRLPVHGRPATASSQ